MKKIVGLVILMSIVMPQVYGSYSETIYLKGFNDRSELLISAQEVIPSILDKSYQGMKWDIRNNCKNYFSSTIEISKEDISVNVHESYEIDGIDLIAKYKGQINYFVRCDSKND